jgi:hypothetical protein
VFILSFGEDGPETDVISTGSRSFIRMAIGFDPETEVCYFLTTAIEFVESLNAHELSFWLSAEHPNGFEETLWDGSETRFIRRPDRGLIWQAILLGLRVLVTWIGPERVLMLTMREHLPDRAVQKYLQINRVFVELRYSVTECDPRHGNRCWLMERPELV